MYWFAVANSPLGWQEYDEHGLVKELFREWADPVPEILETTPAATVIRNDIIDRPPAKPWSVGRVGLIGDAAHPTTPNLGQGGCLAIEDGIALARALVKHADPTTAWTAFTRERFFSGLNHHARIVAVRPHRTVEWPPVMLVP